MKTYTALDTEYVLIMNSYGKTYRVLYMDEFIGHVQNSGIGWLATPDRLPVNGPSFCGSLMTEAKNVRSMLRTRHDAFLWLLGVRDAARFSQ